jgi:hypothetical protein
MGVTPPAAPGHTSAPAVTPAIIPTPTSGSFSFRAAVGGSSVLPAAGRSTAGQGSSTIEGGQAVQEGEGGGTAVPEEFFEDAVGSYTDLLAIGGPEGGGRIRGAASDGDLQVRLLSQTYSSNTLQSNSKAYELWGPAAVGNIPC